MSIGQHKTQRLLVDWKGGMPGVLSLLWRRALTTLAVRPAALEDLPEV